MSKFTSVNPATEEIIQTFNTISNSQLDEKIRIANSAFLEWRNTAIQVRTDLLLKMASLLKSQKDKLAEGITLEMGKPIIQSFSEIDKCALLCEYYAEKTEEFLEPEYIESDASESYIQYDPLGVVLGIMPWNFPYWQVFRFAVPAIMAGNTILIKHAPNVTLVALQIEKLFVDAGFPDGILKILLIDVGRVEGIIANANVKGVSVTASERTGSIVASQAGKEIKKTVLELGGSDPFIVLVDADVKLACDAGAASRLVNSGQTCISAKRFIVVESKYDEFLEAFTGKISEKKVGDPMDKSTDVGPLARKDILDNLQRQVDESVSQGAKTAFGGERFQSKGNFFKPAILTDIKKGMPVYDEETFGPVSAVIKARDAEEAIRIANDTRFGLGASLWTENIELAKELTGRINTGHVSINGMVKSDPRLPFGGINRSGYGRELSSLGLREFVNIKTVWIK